LDNLLASLRLEPDQPSTLTEISLVYGKMNEYDKAISLLNHALRARSWISSKAKARVLRRKGAILIDMKQLGQAQECLAESLRYEPGNKIALEELHYIGELRTGDIFPRPITTLRVKGIEKRCDHCGKIFVENQINKFYVMNIGGNLVFACPDCANLDKYKNAVFVHPDYAVEYYNQGIYCVKNKCWEDAIQAFENAIVVDPQYAEAYIKIGSVYNEIEKHEKAIEAFTKALEIEPDSADSFCGLGDAYNGLKERKRAIQCYKQAIENNEDHAEAYYSLGVIYATMKQLDLAIDACNQAIKIDPYYTDAYCILAVVFAALDRLQKSADVLKELSRIDLYNPFAILPKRHSSKKYHLSMRVKYETFAVLSQKAQKDNKSIAEVIDNLVRDSIRVCTQTRGISDMVNNISGCNDTVMRNDNATNNATNNTTNHDDNTTNHDDSITNRITNTQSRILEEILNEPKITSKELAKIIGVHTVSIKKNLAILKQQGLIKRIGNNRSGYWKIIKNDLSNIH